MANLVHDALSIVEAYHQAWTSGDVQRALIYVSDDVRCFPPDEPVPPQQGWPDHPARLAPVPAGAP